LSIKAIYKLLNIFISTSLSNSYMFKTVRKNISCCPARWFMCAFWYSVVQFHNTYRYNS